MNFVDKISFWENKGTELEYLKFSNLSSKKEEKKGSKLF